MICIGSIASAGAFLLVLPSGSKAACYIAAAILGFFVVGSLSVGLDFGCEVAYPVPDNNVTGVMISYSMLVSAIHIIAANFIFSKQTDQSITESRRQNEARVMIGILILTMIIALVFAVISKEDLRKTKIDEENRKSLLATQGNSGTKDDDDLE